MRSAVSNTRTGYKCGDYESCSMRLFDGCASSDGAARMNVLSMADAVGSDHSSVLSED